MRKSLKKTLLISIFAFILSFLNCKSSVKNYPVDFVDRNTILAIDKDGKPLMLVVELDEDGRLSLNKIQTGTIDDVSVLSEKLKVIFRDREKTSIAKREVVIDPQGRVKDENVEKLIENLAEVKAAPIRLIKNNP
jgi:hypothetical protein